ncbi:hypothetical protein H4R34_001828 [Dimargaris verticillata]|uniref:Chloride channel protein n=1 Tax=Dimargaris verticillata TaxID=2761393 RepID=A0A9W8B3X6_9FUNG|nr:hypothetical protein H4R34_001828 [Dimargaris verticillata]
MTTADNNHSPHHAASTPDPLLQTSGRLSTDSVASDDAPLIDRRPSTSATRTRGASESYSFKHPGASSSLAGAGRSHEAAAARVNTSHLLARRSIVGQSVRPTAPGSRPLAASNAVPAQLFPTPPGAQSSVPARNAGSSSAAVRRVVYNDFATIDWTYDIAQAQLRQEALRRNTTPLGVVGLVYDAAQAWIVILVVGVMLGLIASFIDISYEWLSDFRIGYCQTGFYLNQRYCCWAEKDLAHCPQWIYWSQAIQITSPAGAWVYQYLLYTLSSVLLAAISAALVVYYAPYAASSGISEIKTILGGFIMRRFLGFQTLVIKTIGTVLAVASGLCVGKEGSLVHIAGCCGNIVARGFSKFRDNEAQRRQILSAASAAGISVAFGSPIGGVLFSLEEVSYYFPAKTMWRSFFCAMIASVTLKFVNPFRTGKLVAFQVTYDRAWHGFELVFFILIGALGGLIGTAIIRMNLGVTQIRQRTWFRSHPIKEVVYIAAATALINYLNVLMRVDTVELVSNLFTECKDLGYEGICDPSLATRTVAWLLVAALCKVLFAAVTYGVSVPAGILMPSMAIGACFGRAIGIMVQVWQTAHPTAAIFSGCTTDVPCVTPGVYALVGAAAVLAGVTRMTVTTVVVVFELTGALIYVLPIMLSVMVSKWVGDGFGKDGIFDRLIKFHGYPFLGTREDYRPNYLAQDVMTRVQDLVMIASAATTNTLDGLDEFLEYTDYKGFPVVQSLDSMLLVGYLVRSELRDALTQAKSMVQYDGSTVAYFGHGAGLDHPVTTSYVDFRPWLDETPITMSHLTPMFTVIETFRQMGLRYVLITHHGCLLGLLTKKDILRHLTAIQHSHPRSVGPSAHAESGQLGSAYPTLERYDPEPVSGQLSTGPRYASFSGDEDE